MTSRERVLHTLAYRETDRAPANYSAHDGVTQRLMQRAGVRDYEELLQYLNVDMRRVWFGYGQPNSGVDSEGYERTMWGIRVNPTKPDSDPAKAVYPFDEDTTVDDVYGFEWPSADALDYSGVKQQCERFCDDYVTFGGPWFPFFHEVGWTVGQENLFMWMITKPEVLQAIIDGFVSYEVSVLERFLQACEGKLDVFYMGNDFGCQRGLVISPAMWEKFFRRPLQRFFDIAHDFGCKVMKHSCGGVRDIIEPFIEDGVDILDPVQVRAQGMSFDSLARDFGGRIVFHGSIDTQETLPFGSQEDVRAEVRARRECTCKQGGYIMTGSQEFIEDIPLDNILAMYDENCRC
jgi:uroporphyrinogen decarboxylase